MNTMLLQLALWVLVFLCFGAAYLLINKAKKAVVEEEQRKKWIVKHTAVFTGVCAALFVVFCFVTFTDALLAGESLSPLQSLSETAKEKWFLVLFPIGYAIFSYLSLEDKNKSAARKR